MEHIKLKTNDTRWKKILEKCNHDFYHLPGYVELEAKRINGQGAGIVITENDNIAFFPIIVRKIPRNINHIIPEACDAISPYGYPCPVFTRGSSYNPEFMLEAVCELLKVMQEMNIICAFIRLNPMIPFSKIYNKEIGVITVDHFSSIWIDLQRPKKELLRNTRKTHRNLISKARREGFIAREDTTLVNLGTFGKIYRNTMERLGANSMYLFSDMYFEKLYRELGKHFHLWIVEKEKEIAAAGIFPTCNGIVQYHLSGTDERFEKSSPTRLMISEVRDWAIKRGERIFHLGGGLGSKEDGLFKFKAGFSKNTAIFQTMRLVANKTIYTDLTEAWREQCGNTPDKINGFFPAYRKPFAFHKET